MSTHAIKSRTLISVAGLATALALALPAPAARAASPDINCRIDYRLTGWSLVYKHTTGAGVVSCDNGAEQAAWGNAKKAPRLEHARRRARVTRVSSQASEGRAILSFAGEPGQRSRSRYSAVRTRFLPARLARYMAASARAIVCSRVSPSRRSATPALKVSRRRWLSCRKKRRVSSR